MRLFLNRDQLVPVYHNIFKNLLLFGGEISLLGQILPLGLVPGLRAFPLNHIQKGVLPHFPFLVVVSHEILISVFELVVLHGGDVQNFEFGLFGAVWVGAGGVLKFQFLHY